MEEVREVMCGPAGKSQDSRQGHLRVSGMCIRFLNLFYSSTLNLRSKWALISYQIEEHRLYYSVMTCYQCGSSDGTAARLCPTCVAENKAKRVQALNEVKSEASKNRLEDDPLTRFLESPKWWTVGFIVVYIFSFIMACRSPYTGKESPIFLLALALTISFGLVTILTWLYFISKMMVLSPTWAMLSFMIPFAVYFYLGQYWRENKKIVIAHFVFAGACLLTIPILQHLKQPTFGKFNPEVKLKG